MDTCGRCGRDLVAGARLCAFCGAPVARGDAASAQDDPLIGRTLKGAYFIERRIAVGGMGQVYKALHVALEVPVAVKVIRRSLVSDPGVVQRLQQEARAGGRLRHPNIVAITDLGQDDDGTFFMVMEYVGGKDLGQVIAEGAPLPERRVTRIAGQVLAALGEAHAHHILHRDVKPENVMLQARRDAVDAVKVLDFGIARDLDAAARGSRLTQPGMVCGTRGYMSPEQAAGGALDARSDLYSVGVLMYEMLTAQLPVDGATGPRARADRASAGPRPPGALRGEPVSAALEALVLRALSVDPARRPASADAMREELLACLGEAGAEAGEAAATEVLAQEPPRRAGGASRRATTSSLEPAELHAIERCASAVLGPIARYLVTKGRARATSAEQLCEVVATYIPSQADRTRFLAMTRAELDERGGARGRHGR